MSHSLAWFAGRLGTAPAEQWTAEPSAAAETLDRLQRTPGWWAVVADYEGSLTAVRFTQVRDAPLPDVPAWPGLGPRRWRTSIDEPGYLAAVREVRRRIAAGDVYQVNVCRVLERDLGAERDLLALAVALQDRHPAPHAGVVLVPGTEVVCASPELFLAVDGRHVLTGPIKGTAPTPDQLLAKDVDENVMIVDLARNDLSRVCEPGTVETVRLLGVEHHPGLVHLVSRVRGRLRPAATLGDLWSALMPPASVTGAPKSTALRAIADLEPVPRGPYCGAVGWLEVDGLGGVRGELAVGIRTFWSARTHEGRRVLRFGAGAGITWGSDPQAEWAETELKASRLLAVAAGSGAPARMRV